MKVTKTSIHRLTIEKTCGCKATREYEDTRYTKPIAESQFLACPKHNKGAVAEFAGEMLVEALDKEAETAGKNTFVPAQRQVAEGDQGGVVATSEAGGSTQAMGMVMPPKIREKQDPLKPRTASFNRPNSRLPQNTSPTGNLNIAAHEDISPEELEAEGITMDGSIEGVPEDPDVDNALSRDLSRIDEILDDDDSKLGGVSQTLVNRQAAD
jgi:hypothetical protein